ncbi:Conserved hypothetical protein (isoniazid inductible gene protein IniA?) [Mycobacteroides abscessus]|nr:Conserved hypothetical protein (isoniazid inductible gene protein IniA?) [Mycobacteroides abscessus]
MSSVAQARVIIGDAMLAYQNDSRYLRVARLVQRQLRDHFREIANQTTRSLNESLQAAIASARLEAEDRDARTNEVERQLHILRQVNSHVEGLQSADEQVGRRATRDV